ncbi:DUF6626 family protein [Ferrimonas sp. YFM]|uniref:DUF6626 family protein n=1 Tax=Ferrimonas sp. YFM TaxID=3028878 RepID=UPI0025723D6D|nr:DUF6626 family protein [Ferrimonas sp. YFM]BDY05426.1 hypothetical protein F0521_24670 [Ferrimonas sp. YFM]
MTLDEIYLQLKRMGLCKSKYQFSERFLGMSKGYYSVLQVKQRQPSATALCRLDYALSVLARRLSLESGFASYNRMQLLRGLQEHVKLMITEQCKKTQPKSVHFLAV